MGVDQGCVDGLGDEGFELEVVRWCVGEEVGVEHGVAERCGLGAQWKEGEEEKLLMLCWRKWWEV